MTETIKLVAPCCGRELRPAALMYVATTNVRRMCCGHRWSITIRPLRAHPHREMQVHQLDWSRNVGPSDPPTWDTDDNMEISHG